MGFIVKKLTKTLTEKVVDIVDVANQVDKAYCNSSTYLRKMVGAPKIYSVVYTVVCILSKRSTLLPTPSERIKNDSEILTIVKAGQYPVGNVAYGVLLIAPCVWAL